MSVFDTPRLHFRGRATTGLPTGPRSGLVDLATNTALTDTGPFPLDRPPEEYHAHLDAHGLAGKGRHFSGNGHLRIDARVTAVQGPKGGVDTTDPVVGRAVDLWGHYNPYLATTVNRARVFDVDPASPWTTAAMAGQLCVGRVGRSHDTGHMLVADVRGFLPPRWQDLAGRRVLYQFVVGDGDGLDWLADAALSPLLTRLSSAVRTGGADGLVVQFALCGTAVGNTEDSEDIRDTPDHWLLAGTLAPWRADEPRTHPAGRLLVPPRLPPGAVHDRAHPCTVRVTEDGATFNLPTTAPFGHRDDPGSGDLQLRTAGTDRLVAELPGSARHGEAAAHSCGVVTVDVVDARAADEALCLVRHTEGGHRTVLLVEREAVVLADDACVFLEHPDRERGDDHAVEVAVRSYLRGRPAAMDSVLVRQFYNPRALPLDPAACAPGARSGDVQIVRLRAGSRPAGTAAGQPDGYGPQCTLRTDGTGRGSFTLCGARAGTTRLLLTADPDDLPCDPDAPGSAAAAYDHHDALGFWPAAGAVAVRVLPDDWRLDAIGQRDVTFELVYREVLAPYELLHSFMKREVFSLADRCKVETYARLIWQMCDPANKDKTYYMPPGRDLSRPRSGLLLKYLRAQGTAAAAVPVAVPPCVAARPAITTRGQLRAALWQAVTIELASALQYLYAGYSVPAHGAAFAYVRRSLWTPRQLRLACGDGGETLESGIRGSLFDVAREEMMHFLVVNNILMAMGEPFHVPAVDFGSARNLLPMPLDFALEPLHLGSVRRFIDIERPERLLGGVRGSGGDGARQGPAASGGGAAYGSPSELYAGIRDGLDRVPDLFLVERGRGGGEHHLFLRESINAVHPDYQLEVDDLSSALFAVDFVTEQGEGGVLDSVKPPGESHYDTFRRIGDLLMTERTDGPDGQGAPWTPAHPVLRNPTLDTRSPTRAPVTDPQARQVLRLFNRCYFLMLQLMVQHFGESPDASLRRSDLMNVAIDVMTGMMRPLAELLVTLPSGWRGRTAGPSFELEEPPVHISRPDVARRAFTMRFAHLAVLARECPLVPGRVGDLMTHYADHFRAADGH